MTSEEILTAFPERHPPFSPQSAAIEANRCLYCFDAPCTAACPTHIDVPKFIKKIATGNLRGSASAILDSNVLGLSCSRVCPVEVLCEGACVMHRFHREPIEIGRLQRHAMDWFYAHSPSLATAPDRGKRIACIGAGPASLACAAELRRLGFAVTVFERNPLPGGLNTYGVAQSKLRPEDALKEVDLIRSAGVEFKLGIEVGADLDSLERDFDAIFLGVGLGPAHRLAIPGEDLAGVIDALRFIAAYKTSSIEIGRSVAVIGAGNTAMDAATAAIGLGASEVHVIYRRGESDMPAFEHEFEIAKKDGVKFYWFARPVRIRGNTRVETLEILTAEGRHFELPCDTVISSIGQTRLVDLLAHARGVQLDRGNVLIDRATGQTSHPKYFAGGDCVNGGREVVDAVADGKRAAQGIAKMVSHNG